jgi:DNA-binding transcriptional regulator YdaS (Cro superfamily)
MSELFDQPGLRRELSQQCESEGSQSALARKLRLPVSQINEAVNGRRNITEAMANAMGFARVDRYVRRGKDSLAPAATEEAR